MLITGLAIGYQGLVGLNTPHSCPASGYCVDTAYSSQITETLGGFLVMIIGSGLVLLTKRTRRRIISFGAIVVAAVIILALFAV